MSASKNCPETPRQKMIGMMYLVLIALLALNVSSEVLEGFSMVDKGLRSSINASSMKKDVLYEDFQALYNNNPAKVKEWLDKANLLKEKTDSLYDYIQDFKFQIVKLADGSDADPDAIEIKASDNLDVAAQYAIAQGNGIKLRQKFWQYKDMLMTLAVADSAKSSQYKESLFFSTDKKSVKNWENSLFESMPVSAVVTILTKFQSDLRNTELDMLQYLKAQTDASDYRVNKIDALVVPNSSYVIKGGVYSAKIVLAAVDSTARPEVYIQNKKVDSDLYQFRTNKVGHFAYNGHVLLKSADGVSRRYNFNSSYTVGEPTASISNVDLDVVYRGIDNNFNISIPGVSSENTIVKVEGGNLKKKGGFSYSINPTRDGTVKVIVSSLLEGKPVQMGAQDFRVKYIPDPKAFLQYRDEGGVVRQIQQGRLSKKSLLSNDFSLVASYGEDELIKANFKVISFTVSSLVGTMEVDGAKFNASQINYIESRLKRGDVITFKNIKAVGPDAKTRSLNLLQVDL